MFSNPKVRLALRAILAAVITFGVYLKANPSYDKAGLVAAGVAAFWAFAEVFTPLNGIVGFLKPKKKGV